MDKNMDSIGVIIFLLGCWAIFKGNKLLQIIAFTCLFIVTVFIGLLQVFQDTYSRHHLSAGLNEVVKELKAGNRDVVIEGLEKYTKNRLHDDGLFIGAGLDDEIEKAKEFKVSNGDLP